MIDEKKYGGLKTQLDEKEKMLIENISDKVADGINDNISGPIDDISDTLSNANEKAQDLSKSIQTLSQNVQILSSFDFTEQFTNTKNSQEALEKASQEAKSIFEKSKDANNKLIEGLSNALNEWKLICDNLTGIVENIDKKNKSLENTTSNIENSFNSFSSINEKLMETMKKVESEQSSIVETISEQTSTAVENIVNAKLDISSNQLLTIIESSDKQLKQIIDQLSVLSSNAEKNINIIATSEVKTKLNTIEENNKNMLAKVEGIKNKCKPTPLSIITALMSGVIIILNVILLLNK